MISHTPGPWRVERARSISAPTPAGSPVVLSEVIVAEVRSGGCASLEQANANARLIAAAPDMLDALRAIADSRTRTDGRFAEIAVNRHRAIACAAIAQATGETE